MPFQYTPNTFVQSNFGNSGGCFSYKNFGILQVLLAMISLSDTSILAVGTSQLHKWAGLADLSVTS